MDIRQQEEAFLGSTTRPRRSRWHFCVPGSTPGSPGRYGDGFVHVLDVKFMSRWMRRPCRGEFS